LLPFKFLFERLRQVLKFKKVKQETQRILKLGQRILEILKERKKKFLVRGVDLKPPPDNFRV